MLTEEQIKQFALQAGIDITSDTLCRFEGWEAPMQQFARAIEQAVRKEMEGDAKDAERYRWLRSQDEYGSPEELDAAIDAARGQTCGG